MKYFVTGGCGFIGSYLVDKLVEKGSVTVYDNLSSGREEYIKEHLGKKSFKFVKADLNPLLTGWMSYFSLSEVRGFTNELDSWIRRHLRKIRWRQMKRNWKRRSALLSRGLSEERAVISSFNQRGPWWNSGASHMNQAYPKRYFDTIGLASLHRLHSRFHPLPNYSKNRRDT